MMPIIRYTQFIIILMFALLSALPICLLRPFNPKNNHTFFSAFSFLMKYFGGLEIHTEGVDIIRKNSPSILVGNHQHNFDSLITADLFAGKVVVLGKFELALLPLFGQIYVLCGNLLVKRGNRRKAMKSMADLEQKIINDSLTVLFFPEGHRNPNKELLPFKKGAYYTAISTQSPLIPFSISHYVEKLQSSNFSKIHVYVKVHTPIITKGLTKKDIPELIAKTRKVIEEGILELNKK